jgi:hypothetical protein
MKTLYEILNVDLAQEYTKARKLAVVDSIATLLGADLEAEVRAAIASMDIPADDDRYHWIQTLGRAAGADLLTLGKVQPENMLAMANLGAEDFKEAVKVATSSARNWNKLTVEAEKELNAETLPNTMV